MPFDRIVIENGLKVIRGVDGVDAGILLKLGQYFEQRSKNPDITVKESTIFELRSVTLYRAGQRLLDNVNDSHSMFEYKFAEVNEMKSLARHAMDFIAAFYFKNRTTHSLDGIQSRLILHLQDAVNSFGCEYAYVAEDGSIVDSSGKTVSHFNSFILIL